MSQPTIKLNLGAMLQRCKGWINMDWMDIRELCAQEGVTFIYHDPRKPFPLQPDSVDAMYSGYFIQHFQPMFELVPLLTNCRKVLKKGAIFRILTFNLKAYLAAYTEGKLDQFSKTSHLFNGIKTPELKLSMLMFRNWEWQNSKEFYIGSQGIYTVESLTELLKVAGFQRIMPMPFGQSGDPVIQAETKDLFPEHNPVILEASK